MPHQPFTCKQPFPPSFSSPIFPQWLFSTTPFFCFQCSFPSSFFCSEFLCLVLSQSYPEPHFHSQFHQPFSAFICRAFRKPGYPPQVWVQQSQASEFPSIRVSGNLSVAKKTGMHCRRKSNSGTWLWYEAVVIHGLVSVFWAASLKELETKQTCQNLHLCSAMTL